MFRKGPAFSCLILCLAAALPLGAQTYPAAKQVFVGLIESRGPESLSLGGALSAYAQDLGALDENPAGMAEMQDMQIGLGHSLTLQDSSLELAQFGRAIQGYGSFGAKLKYLNLGSFERRDDYGQLLPGSFQPYEWEGLLGGGYALGSRLDLGVSFGFLQQNIAGQAQQGFDLNLGGLWKVTPAWRLGLGLKGFGGGLGENPLPGTAYLGATFKEALADEAELLATGQGNIGLNGVSSVGLGLQLGWKKIYLRVGYNLSFEEATLSGLQGLGAGLGASLYAFSLDYGFAFQGDLGQVQALNLTYHWTLAKPTAAGTRSLQVASNLKQLAQNPKDKRLWMETGKLYLSFDHKADAATCFKWALSLDPGDEEAKKLLQESLNK